MISGLLHTEKFVFESLHYLPVAGWDGDNLIELSEHMPWYRGPTLLQLLDRISDSHAQKYKEGPLRMFGLMANTRNPPLIKARVLSGSVREGDELTVLQRGPRLDKSNVSLYLPCHRGI